MVASQREAAGLPPAWLADASAGEHPSENLHPHPLSHPHPHPHPGGPPRALVEQLNTCLFAVLVRRHFSDLVAPGVRLATGGHRTWRRAGDTPGGDAFDTFAAFASAALARVGLPTARLGTAELRRFAEEELDGDFAAALRRLAVVSAVRALLAPLLESMVLCDQLLFLHERGVRRCAAVPLFEPTRSPRNVAVLALKDQTRGSHRGDQLDGLSDAATGPVCLLTAFESLARTTTMTQRYNLCDDDHIPGERGVP
jgi:hypothetical protein